jgi:hypothetical protein
VPVTRHFSLTHETNHVFGAVDSFVDVPELPLLFPKPGSHPEWYPRPVTKVQLIGFCDWLSIYQRHPGGGLPKVADGAVMRIDSDGQVESVTLKKQCIEGSHETSVFVRCDGETVWFDGNVSKWGRPDNVFGYPFRQCLLIINNLLQNLGLPPFTDGERYISNFKGDPRTCWTGAMVTRVDVTRNFSVGSKENAYHFMRYLQGQQASRLKTGTYGDGETVDWGRGSRRLYFKAYLKGPELRRHISRAAAGDSFVKPAPNPYVLQLADWCDSVGLVRVEMTFKATKLHDMGCHYLGGFDMKQLEIEFEERCEVLTRASADVDELTELPKALLSTYRMWQAGDDLTAKLSRASFYRHRTALLPYGVDIAIKSNVVPLKTKTRVIQLGPVSMPDFYELPTIERKRNGTHH